MNKKNLIFLAAALIVCFVIAFFVSPYASPHPDGLERVAEDKGFLEKGEERPFWEDSPFQDYIFPGIENEKLSIGLAGILGTLIVFTIATLLSRYLKRKVNR